MNLFYTTAVLAVISATSPAFAQSSSGSNNYSNNATTSHLASPNSADPSSAGLTSGVGRDAAGMRNGAHPGDATGVGEGRPSTSMTTSKTQGDGQPAVRTSSSNNTANAPVSGRNSFTEGEAKSRIEARGYSQVTSLQKDDQGVWRGVAMKDGRKTPVALDFEGNVTGPTP